MERSACPTCGSCSGMFTANSMNCLNEALGLALPGNGTLLATHARRWELFEAAGKRIVEMAKRHYVDGDASVLPRSIATFEAFENAMTLDIAMGGSTNTVLHILAIAHEAGVEFTMADIDRLSRKVPEHLQGRAVVAATTSRTCTARAASSPSWASWIAPGSSTARCGTVHAPTMGEAIDAERHPPPDRHRRGEGSARWPRRAACRRRSPSRRTSTSPTPTTTSRRAASATSPHAYSKDGGLAVLYGNIAEDGCIVKTAGVDESILEVRGAGARLPLAGGGLRRHHRPTRSSRATWS